MAKFWTHSITFKNLLAGGMNLFLDLLFPWNILMMGGGSFFLQVFTNQTWKVDFVYNHSSHQKKSLYILVDI